MSQRILITPRSLTQGLSPDLQPLEKAGYKLVYAPAGKTPPKASFWSSSRAASAGWPGWKRSRSG